VTTRWTTASSAVTRSARSPTGPAQSSLTACRSKFLNSRALNSHGLVVKGRPNETLWTDIVIILTRLGNGMQVAVNPDLIERAEHTPDTVITLVDGHKLVVEEPLDEVIARIRAWRAGVAGEALLMVRMAQSEAPHTSRLPGPRRSGHQIEDDAEAAATADLPNRGSILGQVLHLPAREV
jgi:flagellar protein FlbD